MDKAKSNWKPIRCCLHGQQCLHLYLPYSFPHSWMICTSLDSFGLCPSWPRVPTCRHRSFQGPFLKAMWMSARFVSFHPALCCHKFCMLTGADPHATPQGISTCPHFQALQTAFLFGASFLQLWTEPTEINRPIYSVCGQHTSAGHGARGGSLDQFYLDMMKCLCCFWEARDSFQW